MKHSRNGMVLGLVLAFAAILGSWPGLLLAIVFGVAGGVVGAHFDGRIDLRTFLLNLRGRD